MPAKGLPESSCAQELRANGSMGWAEVKIGETILQRNRIENVRFVAAARLFILEGISVQTEF